ncbi:uncharacterized protein LOC110389670 isoform X3 [Numida meleagris]|uniref:uncharacterized protein LOC110389670 isoform X3 n=1 Tax=Numida meleagris TaxID=8996 RepID=UPI000B3D91F9|nr:uncharacterized protein LOC110389670 isoform X3 [Numida meleagris]
MGTEKLHLSPWKLELGQPAPFGTPRSAPCLWPAFRVVPLLLRGNCLCIEQNRVEETANKSKYRRLCSLRYGEPQVSESFASAVGVGEEERWEPICRSRFLSKRRNAGRCWGLFVRVFPPEQASETVSGRRRNDWEF